ncbi:MAG: CAAX prenyl protease-related protein [Planctomycetia bacterium]|nr:CAAX prenyl protease-related protein [Planctomycetia bacterium]
MENTAQNPSKEFLSLLAPLVVFMIFTSLEPTAGQSDETAWIPYRYYPVLYTWKIIITAAVTLLCFCHWRKIFPIRWTKATFLALFAGILGTILWVGVCKCELEKRLFPQPVSVEAPAGENIVQGRSGYNPFDHLEPGNAWRFWILRMVGLALLVPLIEEFFLRGFLLRYVVQNDWSEVPLGTTNATVWIATLIYAAATHPGEAVAAMLWFGGVTWFVQKTRNIWDAVLIHMVTNFCLGIYVLQTGEWWFL